MDSGTITLNIVEPGSNIPVPNTGLFTYGINGPETTIITIGSVLLVLVLISIITLTIRKQKSNKHDHKSENVFRLSTTIFTFKRNKKIFIPFIAIAPVVLLSVLASLLLHVYKINTNAIESKENNQNNNNFNTSLTVKANNAELTIEVGGQPVFAVLPVQVTVEEATKAGYTLTAYTNNTDLVSTTNPNNKIPMVTVEGDELTTLKDNTWGLALDNEPTSKDNKVYKTLSTDQDNPTIIKTIDDYSETEANDTTTIYYGFYITPDMPVGTYTSAHDIAYQARPNLGVVKYNGNGLYFNGDENQTRNNVKYTTIATDETKKYSHTPNINDDGTVISGLGYDTTVNSVINTPGATKLKIELTYGGGLWYDSQWGYLSFWEGSHPNYRANVDYRTGIQRCGDSSTTDGRFSTAGSDTETVRCEITGDTVTFDYWTENGGPGGSWLWYGFYAIVTGYDIDGNIIHLKENYPVSGKYKEPGSKAAYRFLGWSKSEKADTVDYANEDEIKKDPSLATNIVTNLYAVWEPLFAIYYDGNDADSTSNMDNVEQYTAELGSTSQLDLLVPNFRRKGHGFIGWSTDNDAWNKLTDNNEENDPTIYGPNQTITVDNDLISLAGDDRKLTLYAIWAPVKTDSNGNPVYLQNWQGCSSLTATTYNQETGTLSVGKNTIIVLADNRDGEIYTIAKLADGNCWMTENLRLDNSETKASITAELSRENTNNPSLPLTNIYGGTTSNRLSSSNNNWCSARDDEECLNQSYLNTSNVTLNTESPIFSQEFSSSSTHADFDDNILSYGNYYNWYSATAGRGTYSTGGQGTETVVGDICPVGWQLPYGGSGTEEGGGNTNGGFYYLNQRMGGNTSSIGSNNWRSFPNNFVYSGEWQGSSASGTRGEFGIYWSSTTFKSGDAYDLSFHIGSIDVGTYGTYTGVGGSIRCLAK